ncbi:MAG: filamentous hemagglutinin N-terminal domain-containing protein [Lyngbya sp.]|nr:filamentous hemagglutinin N-terminal domain-containing protein [Lyngbya sp.]
MQTNLLPIFTGVVTFCSLIGCVPVNAQIVPDRTLGNENSVVTPNVNIRGIPSDRIDGGAVRGGNLFHSFEEFNVDEGRGAYFSNPDNIINILTRVTGGNISQILGTLGVLGNANLFLINPNGIVFGPNARLDVGGSFFASTADGILFENGFEFAASNPEAPPLLTINIPIGLNLRENPGSIVNQASTSDSEGNITGLDVPNGNSLLLVGGDITIDGGRLNALGGRIELAGLSTPGSLGFTVENNNINLNVPENSNLSNINLNNDARVSVLGTGGGDIIVNANNFTASDGGRLVAGTEGTGNGGDIVVNADNILIVGRSETFGSGVYNQALPGSSGSLGDIRINTQTINIIGTGAIDPFITPFSELGFTETGIQNLAFEETTGSTGEIVVNAEALNITSGAGIRTATLGAGHANDITITAKNAVLSESGFIESATLEGVGNAGSVSISGETLSLRGGVIGTITFGESSAGNLTINASETVELVGFTATGSPSSLIVDSSSGQGSAGNLTINTSRLVVQDGASISTNAGAGSVGDLTINASESIELKGTSASQIPDLSFVNGSSISAFARGDSNAGNITITTGRLIVRDGGSISAGSINGNGNAGNITIRASEIEISGETEPEQSSSLATNLTVRTLGGGNAGVLNINTERLIIRDGGRIDAGALGKGNGGSINIQATELEISGTEADGLFSSQILTVVGENGTGKGGNITINAERLIIRDGGEIDASTLGRGNAGSINIQATELQLTGTDADGTSPSQILTIAGKEATGNAGNITINTERLMIQDGGTIDGGTLGSGNGGSINIRAADIQLIGTQRIINPSSITTQTFGRGAGGNITIETERLSLQDGAEIAAGTSAASDLEFNFDNNNNEVIIPPDFNPDRGPGGTIVIRASESVELSGNSSEFPSNISNISSLVGLNTNSLGGTIFIETEKLSVRDGAEISSSTFGIGNAGSVTVQAEEVELSGTTENGILSSNLSAEVSPQAVGTGGTVSVNTGLLEVRDRANITVSSRGIGNPGNLQVTASDLRLDTQGNLSAASATGQGGNIGINVGDTRLLGESEILATGSESGQTFEGNIEINTNLLLLLEGSSIVTDAFNPTGGSNINIRPFDSSELGLLQSQDSVISAAGDLSIDNTLNYDPTEAPEVTVVDPNDLIAQDPCKLGRNSSFIITGRGGIAPDPTQALSAIEGLVEWESLLIEPVTPQPNNSSQRRQQKSRNRDNNRDDYPVDSRTIVPARGWIRNEKGEVILVGYDPTKTGVQRQPNNPRTCQP